MGWIMTNSYLKLRMLLIIVHCRCIFNSNHTRLCLNIINTSNYRYKNTNNRNHKENSTRYINKHCNKNHSMNNIYPRQLLCKRLKKYFKRRPNIYQSNQNHSRNNNHCSKNKNLYNSQIDQLHHHNQVRLLSEDLRHYKCLNKL